MTETSTFSRPPLIAVCGTSSTTSDEDAIAERVGGLLALRGATVVCGGLDGVMAAAARGAKGHGGRTIGFLPGEDPAAGNDYLTYAIPTGLGEMRNSLIARSSVGMIAIGGGYGTLSEIGFMLRLGRPVACIASWDIYRPRETARDPNIFWADDADEAVEWLWKAFE